MKKLFKYLSNLVFKIKTTQLLPMSEVDALLTIAKINANYLRAHISTSSALMNSYPARSIKRRNSEKFIERLQTKLSEQETDIKNYLQMTKARSTPTKN